jgi:hypothetical protein
MKMLNWEVHRHQHLQYNSIYTYNGNMWKNHYFHSFIIVFSMPLVNNFLVKNCESFRLHCVLNDETLQMLAKNTLSTFVIFRLVKLTLFWLRLMYNFNCKFPNFPLFHPSVNCHFKIIIISSFYLYVVADWLRARLQTSGTRTIAIYLHSQI